MEYTVTKEMICKNDVGESGEKIWQEGMALWLSNGSVTEMFNATKVKEMWRDMIVNVQI